VSAFAIPDENQEHAVIVIAVKCARYAVRHIRPPNILDIFIADKIGRCVIKIYVKVLIYQICNVEINKVIDILVIVIGIARVFVPVGYVYVFSVHANASP